MRYKCARQEQNEKFVPRIDKNVPLGYTDNCGGDLSEEQHKDD